MGACLYCPPVAFPVDHLWGQRAGATMGTPCPHCSTWSDCSHSGTCSSAGHSCAPQHPCSLSQKHGRATVLLGTKAPLPGLLDTLDSTCQTYRSLGTCLCFCRHSCDRGCKAVEGSYLIQWPRYKNKSSA